MQYRTDLASEAYEMRIREEHASEIRGVRANEEHDRGFAVTTVNVLDDNGADTIGKPVGTYVTISLDPLFRREEDAFVRACDVVADRLRRILPDGDFTCLVAGIGNPAITPDAVGPLTIRHIMVTRHMIAAMPAYFGQFRPVSAVSPGVLGMTGVETGEILKGIVERTRPDCMIAVDALASRSTDRLCTTVQLSDTGIVPGSGVNNARNAIDRDTLGIPVIAVGVPTVVDAATLAYDLLERAGSPAVRDLLPPQAHQMMVTPREIDTRVADTAKLIGYGINLALHDDLTVTDIDLFLS